MRSAMRYPACDTGVAATWHYRSVPRTRPSLRASIAEATRDTPLPPGTGRFLLGIAGLILAVGLFVWWNVRASDAETSMVRQYVDALRGGDDGAAYALLTSSAKGALAEDAWRADAGTALLRASDGLRIDAVRPIGDANKGCVRAVVSASGAETGITFYVRDENGPRIQAVLGQGDAAGGDLMTIEPWQCF